MNQFDGGQIGIKFVVDKSEVNEAQADLQRLRAEYEILSVRMSSSSGTEPNPALTGGSTFGSAGPRGEGGTFYSGTSGVLATYYAQNPPQSPASQQSVSGIFDTPRQEINWAVNSFRAARSEVEDSDRQSERDIAQQQREQMKADRDELRSSLRSFRSARDEFDDADDDEMDWALDSFRKGRRTLAERDRYQKRIARDEFRNDADRQNATDDLEDIASKLEMRSPDRGGGGGRPPGGSGGGGGDGDGTGSGIGAGLLSGFTSRFMLYQGVREAVDLGRMFTNARVDESLAMSPTEMLSAEERKIQGMSSGLFGGAAAFAMDAAHARGWKIQGIGSDFKQTIIDTSPSQAIEGLRAAGEDYQEALGVRQRRNEVDRAGFREQMIGASTLQQERLAAQADLAKTRSLYDTDVMQAQYIKQNSKDADVIRDEQERIFIDVRGEHTADRTYNARISDADRREDLRRDMLAGDADAAIDYRDDLYHGLSSRDAGRRRRITESNTRRRASWLDKNNADAMVFENDEKEDAVLDVADRQDALDSIKESHGRQLEGARTMGMRVLLDGGTPHQQRIAELNAANDADNEFLNSDAMRNTPGLNAMKNTLADRYKTDVGFENLRNTRAQYDLGESIDASTDAAHDELAHNPIGARAIGIRSSTQQRAREALREYGADSGLPRKIQDLGILQETSLRQNYLDAFRAQQVDLRMIDTQGPHDAQNPAVVLGEISKQMDALMSAIKDVAASQ